MSPELSTEAWELRTDFVCQPEPKAFSYPLLQYLSSPGTNQIQANQRPWGRLRPQNMCLGSETRRTGNRGAQARAGGSELQDSVKVLRADCRD